MPALSSNDLLPLFLAAEEEERERVLTVESVDGESLGVVVVVIAGNDRSDR